MYCQWLNIAKAEHFFNAFGILYTGVCKTFFAESKIMALSVGTLTILPQIITIENSHKINRRGMVFGGGGLS